MQPSTLLFLCTGNYFRSRFAEILFNHRALYLGIPWRAESRGIAVAFGAHKIGPLSPHARRGLGVRGIRVPEVVRFPQPLHESDLRGACHVVAVKEAEHRPLLRERFGGWEDRVEYWDIDDIDCALPDTALSRLEERVEQLLARVHPAGDKLSFSSDGSDNAWASD